MAVESSLHEFALRRDVLGLVLKAHQGGLDIEVGEQRRVVGLRWRHMLAGANVTPVDSIRKCLVHVDA